MPARRVFWWSECLEIGEIVVENINDYDEKFRLAREDHRRIHPYCTKPVMVINLRSILMAVLPYWVAKKIADILETPQRE